MGGRNTKYYSCRNTPCTVSPPRKQWQCAGDPVWLSECLCIAIADSNGRWEELLTQHVVVSVVLTILPSPAMLLICHFITVSTILYARYLPLYNSQHISPTPHCTMLIIQCRRLDERLDDSTKVELLGQSTLPKELSSNFQCCIMNGGISHAIVHNSVAA